VINLGKFYNNPRELTPNQIKYINDYCKKSKDYPEEFKEIPEFHYVYEWDDGAFVDYTVEDYSGVNYKGENIKDKSFYIWALFSRKDTVRKFNAIVDIAKNEYGCNAIRFSTLRNQKAWIKNLKKAGIKVTPEQTIFKCDLKEISNE